MKDETSPILDLRGVKCPLNYVKAKLALNKLPGGSKLKILIDLGEPVEMVPKSLKADNFCIVQQNIFEGSHCELLVKKPEG